MLPPGRRVRGTTRQAPVERDWALVIALVAFIVVCLTRFVAGVRSGEPFDAVLALLAVFMGGSLLLLGSELAGRFNVLLGECPVLLLLLATNTRADDAPSITVGGTVELFWSWNFAQPENGVTALRGFDNRHNTISLANVAVSFAGDAGPMEATVALQAGLTPNTYTLAEPSLPAEGGVGASNARTWRNVQQAWGAWHPADVVVVEAGLFLSPIGPESLAVKDSWNFSRSDLFYGLPFYHTGVRTSWRATDGVEVTWALYNGWNSVVDNNPGKSPSVRVLGTAGPVTAAGMYFGGPERSAGAPEGHPWRHLVDLWVQVDATDRVSFLVHGDVGGEENQVGSNLWLAGAVYVRARAVDDLYLAARGDWFRETVRDGSGPIFWPLGDDEVGRIASVTLTLDWRPVDLLSLRLEGRRDMADDPMFFDHTVRVVEGVPIADDIAQNTVTAGVVAWF